MDKSGSSVLLISKYILEHMQYNITDFSENRWEKCTLRNWLNNDFLNAAFSSAEQLQIKTTTVVNEDNPNYGTDGGKDTYDKVFILSINEAKKYFKNDDNDENGWKNGTSVARATRPTEYAKLRGKWTYQWEEGQNPDKKKFDGNSWWWLRSPGNSFSRAAYVGHDGVLSMYGAYVYDDIGNVRPAMWINLS